MMIVQLGKPRQGQKGFGQDWRQALSVSITLGNGGDGMCYSKL
jgi:hypothetical protein